MLAGMRSLSTPSARLACSPSRGRREAAGRMDAGFSPAACMEGGGVWFAR